MDRKIVYAFPSANMEQAKITEKKWHDAGYATLVLLDAKTTDINLIFHEGIPDPNRAVILVPKFETWAIAHNYMSMVYLKDKPFDIYIAGSDDFDPPDPAINHETVLFDMRERFGSDIYGVMQPVGDKYGDWKNCCTCPWMGKGWIKRGYQGSYPIHFEYYHLWCDRELADVLKRDDLLWMNEDIKQFHHHWCREGEDDFLTEERRQNIKDMEAIDKRLYLDRMEAGFPGS